MVVSHWWQCYNRKPAQLYLSTPNKYRRLSSACPTAHPAPLSYAYRARAKKSPSLPCRDVQRAMPGRPNIGPCRAGPCPRSLGRYGPSCLAGHVSTGFVSSLRPKAWLAGWFSCRAGLLLIKPTTTHFHQYFHQILKYFIIFTNITINNIYI